MANLYDLPEAEANSHLSDLDGCSTGRDAKSVAAYGGSGDIDFKCAQLHRARVLFARTRIAFSLSSPRHASLSEFLHAYPSLLRTLAYLRILASPLSILLPFLRTSQGSYVGIHSTGFRDFLLKPELLRAISDLGFEHPSEGESARLPLPQVSC